MNSFFDKPILIYPYRSRVGSRYLSSEFLSEWKEDSYSVHKAFLKDTLGVDPSSQEADDFPFLRHYTELRFTIYASYLYPFLKRFELAKKLTLMETFGSQGIDISKRTFRLEDLIEDERFFPKEAKTPEFMRLYEHYQKVNE